MLNDVAARLGLTVQPGSRARPDGELLRWRLAGLEQASAEPLLPFFIEWGPGFHPGRAPVQHPAGAVEIAEIRLTGDADRLGTWVGTGRLPVSVSSGAPAVAGVVLRGEAGEIVLA